VWHLYPEMLGHASLLSHYSPLQMCSLCLFVPQSLSVKDIALPVIIATAEAKITFIPFTASCQKTLNTYITWQPLKDAMFTHSAFSLLRK